MTCPPAHRLLELAAGGLADGAIEQHIDTCAECRAVLSNLARGDVPPSFGRYRLDTVLGSGGMGIVYRAWDPQLARAVAIKVVRRAGEDESGRARLAREAQALARLSHPNVCHVYDVGSEGDEVWVAMELIDGTSLRHWTGDGDELMRLLVGAAEGLAAAHAAGLVHRDVKPENVLVTRDGRPVVTDFGLARAEDAIDPNASTLSTDPHLTASGAIAGTPAYLAPEQLTGDPIDARVDQFAWAVMAWELLTGVRPFPVVFAVRLEAVRAGVTPPPSLAPAVAAALARAMAASPRDRFASMRELIDALAAPAPPARRPRRVAAVAALAVVATGGAVLAAWRSGGSSPPPPPPTATPPPPPPSVVVATIADAAPAITIDAAPVHVAVAPRTVKKPPPPGDEVTLTHADVKRLADAIDPAMSRATAIAMMSDFCYLPYDPAHPDPAEHKPIADWGKVTRTERVIGKIGDRDFPMQLVEVAGVRATYRFQARMPGGRIDAAVGDLLMVCVDDPIDIYQLPAAWQGLSKMMAVAPISAPPRIVDYAKLAPLHIRERDLRTEGKQHVLRLAADRRYLVEATAKTADGDRWNMGEWSLVAPGLRVTAGRSQWFVLEQPAVEDARVVARAVAVVDEMFP